MKYKLTIIIISMFLLILSGCSIKWENDTPPDMIKTAYLSGDMVYRGEKYVMDDLVYRGEEYEIQKLSQNF